MKNLANRENVFYVVVITLIFISIPPIIRLNFIGGIIASKLVVYPLYFGVLLEIYCLYKGKNNIFYDLRDNPYLAKAVLCYFPECDRNQGVDYTNTELDIHFGRVNGKNTIDTINDNIQGDTGDRTTEEDARDLYRKWDNTKYIVEYNRFGANGNSTKRSKKVYEGRKWGLELNLKKRRKSDYPQGLRFGVVITLKALDAKNRVDDFIAQCFSSGWLVNAIDIEEQLRVQEQAEHDITWD